MLSNVSVCVLRDFGGLSNTMLKVLLSRDILVLDDIFINKDRLVSIVGSADRVDDIFKSIGYVIELSELGKVDLNKYIFKDKDTPIKYLNLSVRAINCLMREGYDTLYDVMFLSDTELLSIPNLGYSSLVDIRKNMFTVRDDVGKAIIDVKVADRVAGKNNYFLTLIRKDYAPDRYVVYFRGTDRKIYSNIAMSDTLLSEEVISALTKLGYKGLDNIIKTDYHNITDKTDGLNEEELSELINYLTNTCIFIRKNKGEYNVAKYFLYDLIDDLYVDLKRKVSRKVIDNYLCRYLIKESNYVGDYSINDPEIMNKIYSNSVFTSVVYNLIDDILYSSNGVSLDELYKALPVSFLAVSNSIGIIKEYLNNEKYEQINGRYYIKAVSIIDYIKEVSSERDTEIILERLNGGKLQDIGDKYGITRERVNQIVRRTIYKRPYVIEDRYKTFYLKYNIDPKFFCYLLDVEPYVYTYLDFAYGSNKGGISLLENIWGDENLTQDMRVRFNNFLTENNYILLYGKCICKVKKHILEAIMLHNHSNYPCKIDTVLKELQIICRDNNMTDKINKRSMIRALTCIDNVLISDNGLVRYCRITDDAINKVFNTIDFNRYKGLSISALKLFKDYSWLMKEIGIKTEYELHNLFRSNKDKLPKYVSLGRIPTVKVGI